MNTKQKKDLYESIMKSVSKTVKRALNENGSSMYDDESYDMYRRELETIENNELELLSRMSRREKIKAFRKYVNSYYTAFPELLEEDIEEGMSHVNWGEIEGYGTDVANAICTILQKDESEWTENEKADVDLAWSIADKYLEKHN